MNPVLIEDPDSPGRGCTEQLADEESPDLSATRDIITLAKLEYGTEKYTASASLICPPHCIVKPFELIL